MNKNTKHIFLLAALVVLLVGLTAVSAGDVSDNITADNTVSHVTAQDTSSAASVQTTDNKVSDNKKVQTTTKTSESKQKTVKKDTQINYYVSDTNGSDSNDGSNSKPYKTIAKAINGTTQDNTYNIHIRAGNYTGTGNTNLTVNGNYHINFIGEGVNKTVLDGEVNFTVGNGTVWGEDNYWNPYSIKYGNWGMNITSGNGHITISDMNFQHMYTTGGSSIELNPMGGITNYANLTINNVLFYRNLGGVGASIQNKAGATLTVNNTTFLENRKGSSTGCQGTSIYNNGTAIVNNSQFIKNAARWGTITNDHILNISNSIIRDGISYDLASTYKSGSGISIFTGDNDYFNGYSINGIKTNIQNCTFINNGQVDIRQGPQGDLVVNNSVFNHSTGIVLRTHDYYETYTSVITNNKLIDMQPSSLFGDLSGENKVIFGIYNEYNNPTTSDNNDHSRINITGNTITLSDSGYAIRTSSNAYIANNTLSDKLTIAGGANCTVINNNITTDSLYAVELTNYNGISENNTITNNYLIGRTSQGNQAVTPSSKDVIANNTPVSQAVTVTINDDNYNQYFNNDGTIFNNSLPRGSTVTLTRIHNKKFIIEDTYLTIKGSGTLYNTTIIVKPTGRVFTTGLTINNINSTEPAIVLNSTYNTLTRAIVTVNTVHPIHAMEVNAPGNTISGGMITLTCPVNTVITDNNGYTTARSIGVLVTSGNNTFKSNHQVRVTGLSSTENTTIIGIAVQTNNSSRPLTNNQFNRERITVTGNNSIGLYINNAYNNTVKTGSQISVTGNNITGVKIDGNSTNNILQGTCSLRGTGYGVANTGNVDNSTFSMSASYKIRNANNITITAGVNSADNSTVFDLENITNSAIRNTGLSITRSNVTLLKLVNSTNITINSLQVTGNANNPYNITLMNSSDNIINNSRFTYTNGVNLVNSTGNNITNNYISTPRSYGDEAVTNPEGNIVLNNTPVRITITNTTYFTLFDKEGNFIYNGTVDIIGLGSDLYGVDLLFNQTFIFENIADYTIHNGTVKIIENTTINGININNTDKTALKIDINNGTYPTVRNENIIVAGNNITAIIIQSNTTRSNIISFNYNNITVTGKNVTAIRYSANSNYASFTVSLSNFTVTADDTATMADINKGDVRFNYINAIVNGQNKSTVFNSVNANTIIADSNITQQGKISTTLQGFNSSISWSDGNKENGFSRNNVNITGENVSLINIQNQTQKGSYTTVIRDNNVIINAVNPVTAINLDGNEINITGNNIITNTTNGNTPVINIANGTDNNVINNYIQANDMEGDYAVNHTGITIKFNTPGVKITDDNYNQYFTDGILNPNITTIQLGGDIHNKNMTFNNFVLIVNPNNYTIYNGTIIFNKEAHGSNITQININNTDDRQSSIIVYSNETNIINNNIYQENTNNKAQVILLDNITTQVMTSYMYITNNTITAKAPYLTAINLTNSSSLNFTYNAGDMGYPVWRNVTDGKTRMVLYIENNNITLQSSNPATAIGIGNINQASIRYNKIISDTYNNNTPLINIIQSSKARYWGVMNNYIESRDITGDNAAKADNFTISGNTPTNTTRAIKINMTTLPEETKTTSTYPITVNIENMFNEGLNGTITLKIDDENITIPITNGTTTYNYTPDAGNHTITATFNGNDTIYTTNSTTQNTSTRKENVTITINPINTAIYENTNITANITDEEGNPVNNGQVFFKINGKTLTDIYGNNIYVDVVNGTATLNYYIDSMKINTTTIVYAGNEYYNTARVNTTVNVERTNATMKLEILNNKVKPGETAIIMVTVTDKNGNMVKSGKVIFKLNGKTIKDANGSTITVRIHNGIAIFKYVVPANYSAKNYTLTAVSVGNTYNRVEAVTNLTLIKINTYIQPVNVQFTGNTLHVQANIISTSTQTNVAYRETKVSVKINNKTFAKEVRITNGTINLNIDTSSIGRGNYKITIKAGENGIYNGTQLDTYTYKAPVKQELNQTSNNGTLVKA